MTVFISNERTNNFDAGYAEQSEGSCRLRPATRVLAGGANGEEPRFTPSTGCSTLRLFRFRQLSSSGPFINEHPLTWDMAS
jgi:hypothetical protein